MPDDLDLQRQLDKHDWRIGALDAWRSELDRRVAVLESEVVTEREARMLREALNANTAQQGRLRLTRLQGFAALAVGMIAAADFVRSLVHG